MSSFKSIINDLLRKNISISVVESCTGGKIIKEFTDIPGISKIFHMGLVTYSDKSKNLLLKIPNSIIKTNGSVSKEVAFLMTKNLSKISKCKLLIATTGIAGPSGGSLKKPVGLVYISIIFCKKNYIFRQFFTGNRSQIQQKTVNFCFQEIKKLIQ
mgnify:CR=1 FL=1